MCTVPQTPTQSKPARLDLCCRSETVKRGEVRPVYKESAWLRQPTPRRNGWTGAVLDIEGTTYSAECFFVADAGHVWQIVDLTKRDGTTYRLSFGRGGEHCDCPQSVYRRCRCKHVATVRAALDWLEAKERAEWADAVA
jgi:hypothetical protein